MKPLRAHQLGITLIHPQIAPNTGNIARLCVATGTELHLVRPFGFLLTDSKLKRSAMDYWPRLKLTIHDDLEAFLTSMTNRRIWLCENGASRSIWETEFKDGDMLVMGSEGPGIPGRVIESCREQLIGIPQAQGERCLNVSTAAGIVLSEALRQVQFNLTP